MQNSVLIIDYGSQVTQLIARKIRELGVYCEIKNPNISFDEIEIPQFDSASPKSSIMARILIHTIGERIRLLSIINMN